MLGFVFLSLILCLLCFDLGLYLDARHRAQDAADAAALAAVQESFPLFSSGTQPGDAAGRLARRNGGNLERFDISDGGGRAEVEVSVRPGSLVLRRMGIMPERALAKAAAEVDIEALLQSDILMFTDPTALAGLRYFLAQMGPKEYSRLSTLVVLLALQHLGKRYVLGTEGPDTFDCSGLVYYVYGQVGIRLPRITFDQVSCGRAVLQSDLAPGDLVFFRGNGHVGLYAGGGWFIHAPHSGDVVKLSPLASRSDVSACRRIL